MDVPGVEVGEDAIGVVVCTTAHIVQDGPFEGEGDNVVMLWPETIRAIIVHAHDL